MSDAAAPKRTYRSPLREEQAARTRQRIIDAAAEQFSAHGFVGTTMGGIARTAEVSVESVHATGSKATLLIEAFRTRYAGQGDWASFLEVDAVQEMFAGTDADESIDRVIDFLARGHAGSARLMMELRTTAAVEPLIAEHWDELVTLKRDSFAVSAEWMTRIGIIEHRVPADELPALAASLNVLMSAETYVHLTSDWGFSDEQYRAWLARQMRLVRP